MATKVRERIAVSSPNSGHPNPLISHEMLRQLYSTMLKCRLLYKRVGDRDEQPGIQNDLYGSVGLEATAVGTAIGLRSEDTLAPSHLDLIASYLKGVSLTDLFNRLGGRKRGLHNRRSAGGDYAYAPLNILPPASTVSTQLEMCANIAFANRRMKKDNVAMAFSREGSMPQHEWQDALRFAGKHSLAIVYVRFGCRLAVSASMKLNSNDGDAAINAVNYGFPAITVDARDVVAVYRVAQEAIERARSGGGPTLIEAALTFPGCGTPEIHRTKDGVADRIVEQEPGDPIIVMERYLISKHLFSEGWKNEIVAAFQQELDTAICAAEVDRCGAGA